MPGHLLQQWTTIQSISGINTFTQSAEDWLDVSAFGDAAFLIDVTQASGSTGSTVQLLLQSSPTRDESYFGPIAPPVTLTPTSTPIAARSVRAASTVPLTRFLRWQLKTLNNTSTWGATFRVRVIPSQQSFFVPTQLAGCVLWLRPDLGTTLVTSGSNQFVQQWNDQGPANDSNKNLVQNTPANQPQLISSDGGFNGAPTLALSSASTTFMTSGLWASVLLQPCTWVFVGDNTNGGSATQYLMDGDDTTHGQAVTYVPSTTSLSLFAGGGSFSATTSWANPGALLGEMNGTSSNIYFNNFTSAAASGTVTGGTSGGQASMTFGEHSAVFGGGNNWDGKVAEILAFNRILLPSEKARLRNYLNGRYALGIT